MRYSLATALLLAALAPCCAGSPWIPRSRLEGWRATHAVGARIIGDVAEDELQRLAGDLARFDTIIASLAGRPARAAATPLTVVLFRDRELAERFGLGRRGAAGWALSTLDASFIAVEAARGRDEDRSTLYHEYTHVLLAGSRRAPLPRWYHEGLATYFSTVNERSGALVVGAAPGTVAARVAQRGLMPLDRLFAASLEGMRGEEVADYYATAWALSHYLLASPSGRRELSAFVAQLERGIPSEQAQQLAFGRSADRIGAELVAYVAQLTRGVPVETVIDARELPAPELPAVSLLDPRETAYALGGLALGLVEAGEDSGKAAALAQNLLALALVGEGADPRAEAAFGEVRALRGDLTAADTALRGALARAPRDPSVRLHAARVALLRAEAEASQPGGAAPALAEAEAHYRHALALGPESASAWFGLGRTCVLMGRPDQAFAAFEAARRFGWSALLDVELARLHLERGEREAAAALLRPIAQDPHGGPAEEEAAELLERDRVPTRARP